MSYTSLSNYILALVAALFLASCGGGGGGGENQDEDQVTYLQVLTATPASFAQAPRTGPISVTFSDAIDAASVTTSSFQVTSSEGPLAGVISVQGATITFTPNQPLAIGVRYTATVTPDIRSIAGQRLSAATTWKFDRGHKIAAGGEHICAILPDQRVKCWGDNFYGQLGLGDDLARGDAIRMGAALPAVDLGSGLKAVELAAGGAHTCALLENGQIKCWGRNSGQLGLGDTTNRGDVAGQMGDALSIVDLGIGHTVIQVVAGSGHTCALLDNGLVKCWGVNEFGQLGLGNAVTRGDIHGEMGDSLLTVALGTGRTAIAIAAGASHTCALLDNGQVKCWGWNNVGQLGLGDTLTRGDAANQMGDYLVAVDLGAGRTAVEITAGGNHSCALLDSGTLKCWGRNDSGELGQGDQQTRGDQPNTMGDALMPIDLGAAHQVTAIAIAPMHACVLLDSLQLKCWGSNSEGTLGIGDNITRGGAPGQMGSNLPAVDLGAGQHALEVALSYSNTCAILITGHIKCWGYRNSGLLGLGDNVIGNSPNELGDNLTSVNLGIGRTATVITTGYLHTCALLDNAQIKCWGYSNGGQLGLGDTGDRGVRSSQMGDALPAVDLGSGRSALQVVAGLDHTCAVLDNHQVKCWGATAALGLGDALPHGTLPNTMGDLLPTVDLGSGRSAQQIAAGAGHTCALLDNGQVKCWGSNDSGELGLEDTNSRGMTAGEMGDALPAVNLGTGHTVLQLAAGFNHNCALLENHYVKCWGQNDYGQLGLGDTNKRGKAMGEMGDGLPFVDLGTGRTAISITAGWSHTCALLDDGTLKCWGGNMAGQLGLGDRVHRGHTPDQMGDNLPTIDLGSHRVMSISAGTVQTCATLDSGQLKCWGNNTLAQLGLGDNMLRGILPAQMGDNLSAVDAGTGRTVSKVTTSNFHTCALLDNNQVKCWGLVDHWLGRGLPANIRAVGDDPGEMGDALPTINLGVTSETPVFPARNLRPLSYH